VPEVYALLDATALTIGKMVTEALSGAGVPHRLSSAGSMFSIFFSEGSPPGHPVTNFAEAKTQNVAAFRAFFHAMLDRGVYLPPSAFEAWFVSTALDAQALSTIAAALPAAARAAAEAAPA
jgi:glutamate-1-semialdehyde 2,1-aminomutase